MFVSDASYSRKLATYTISQFLIWNLNPLSVISGTKQMPKEEVVKLPCLFLFNESEGSKEEVVYKHRNLPFSTMCLYSIVNLPIKVLTHYYFERGQSRMEGDNVHATLDCLTEKSEIFNASDWLTAINNAKCKEPKYPVKELANYIVLDFQEWSQRLIRNRRKDINGENVQWSKIHVFQYRKENTNTIYLKDEEFRALPLQGRKWRTETDCVLHQYPLIKPLPTKFLFLRQIKRSSNTVLKRSNSSCPP